MKNALALKVTADKKCHPNPTGHKPSLIVPLTSLHP